LCNIIGSQFRDLAQELLVDTKFVGPSAQLVERRILENSFQLFDRNHGSRTCLEWGLKIWIEIINIFTGEVLNFLLDRFGRALMINVCDIFGSPVVSKSESLINLSLELLGDLKWTSAGLREGGH
jgi:hypothetical protein